MGRPIKSKWFTARDGNAAGDLQLTISTGDEAIIKQTGTGVYEVASGRVKLIDGAPSVAPSAGVVGDAQLAHDGKNVRKLTQYRVYFFDGSDSAVWRDGDGNVVGTFVPALATDPGYPDVTATGTVVPTLVTDANTVDFIIVDDGGQGYGSAPVVTFSTGTGSTATGTAVLTGDVVTSVTIDTLGSYLDIELPITVTFAAP